MTIGFISLGCSKNLVDSQVMAGVLLKNGYTLAPMPESADVIIVNTCAFIESARSEGAETILSVCEYKKNGNCKAVIVAGCMPQRYRKSMLNAFPEVDAFIGVDELDNIAKLVKTVLTADGSKKIPLKVKHGEPTRLFNQELPGLRFSGQSFAYLKVAEGCNHACAFCAIPLFRGHLRSRSLNDITYEFSKLLETGAKEINLIAQDITSFGKDVHNGPKLPELLKALDNEAGDYWVRILYGFPNYVTDSLLETMANSKHVVPYFDLPIQHAHPEILRAMQRADTISAIETFPERIRKAVPNVTLRTTCMVGFPGETEEHFNALYNYVEKIKFDHLGAFIFSPEEGTAAEKLDGLPSEEIAQERFDRLMTLQTKIAAEKNKARIGTVKKALIINVENSTAIARLEHQAPEVDGETIIEKVPKTVKPGDFVSVKIKTTEDFDLTATLV